MLHNQTVAVLHAGVGILLVLSHPFLGDHQLRMRNSSRANFKAPTLELVLRVDFAKELPFGGFAIARRDWLVCCVSRQAVV